MLPLLTLGSHCLCCHLCLETCGRRLKCLIQVLWDTWHLSQKHTPMVWIWFYSLICALLSHYCNWRLDLFGWYHWEMMDPLKDRDYRMSLGQWVMFPNGTVGTLCILCLCFLAWNVNSPRCALAMMYHHSPPTAELNWLGAMLLNFQNFELKKSLSL